MVSPTYVTAGWYHGSVGTDLLYTIFAHYQEHLNCITASGITHVCCCRLVSWECWNWLTLYYFCSSSGASKLYYSFWYHTYVAAGWYHGSVGTDLLYTIFAHHQEHLNCITAYGITHICHCRLVSWECWNWLTLYYFCSSSGASKLYYSFWYHTRMSLLAGIGVLELTYFILFSLIIRSIETVLQLLVSHTYVTAGWYHGSVGTDLLYTIFAHHQEQLNCITASGFTHVCGCRLVLWECWNWLTL